MSKRPGAVSAETKERLLSAAREEFAEYGFQGSSLRRICSAAGVTTGALYFFFDGKDDLFRAVLAQITDPFWELIRAHYARERASSARDSAAGADADFEVAELLISLYFRSRQTWDILLHHLSHPAVRSFLDAFIDCSTEHYVNLLSASGNQVPDSFAIHLFVHMQADSMLTLLSHSFSQEEMMLHARTVIRMLRGAFRALLAE